MTCNEDAYYNFVSSVPDAQGFCETYVNYPNTTLVVEYTPTSTYTNLYTTAVVTSTEIVRTTPGSTVTVTQTVGVVKRDAQVTQHARWNQAQMASALSLFQRQYAAGSPSSTSMNASAAAASTASAFSSACVCHTAIGGPVITSTYTNEAITTTLAAFGLTTTTTTSTHTDATSLTTTTIVISAPPSSTSNAATTATAATTSSPVGATPTAQAIVCPDDDGQTVSQMVGLERFEYMVNCSTELTSTNFYGALSYSTFGQCIGACSSADAYFSSPVCQGVSYGHSANVDGYNCFLKTSSNGSVPDPGFDSAELLRVWVPEPDGSTSTESAPFATATPTQNASQLSAMMSSMMGDSTSNIPMITPGPAYPVSGMLVNAGAPTMYSTYVSNGTTFSTGTVYSTSYTSGNSWFVSYYTSSSLAWAAATTEYAISAQETQVSSSSSSSSSMSSGANGESYEITVTNSTVYYPEGYNVTEVISNQTYAANGSLITSSATTLFFSYQTASGASGGASSGAMASVSATVTAASSAASAFTSTSYYSTQTVIVNNGSAEGASAFAASGAVASSAFASTSANTIVESFAIGGSSGFALSGVFTQTANVTSNAVTATAAIANSNGVGGASSFAASGNIGNLTSMVTTSTTVIVGSAGIGGESIFAASGLITSAPASASVTVIVNSGNSAGVSEFMANGSIGGIAGSSGTALSGALATLSSPPFSDSGAPRAGTYSTTTMPMYTGPAYTPLSPESLSENTSTFTDSGLPRQGTYSLPASPTDTNTFTDSGLPRQGTYAPPLATGPAPYPSFGNAPRNGSYSVGTAPLGTAPIGPGTGLPLPLPPHAGGPFIPASSPSASVDFTGAPRNGTYSTGTAPPGHGTGLPLGPFQNGPPLFPPFIPASAPSSGYVAPTTANGSAPAPTSPAESPFSNSELPRNGSYSTSPPSGTGILLYTAPPSPTACANATMATMTIFSTTTVYGCAATCPPSGYGYGGSPQAFGPPWAPNPSRSASTGWGSHNEGRRREED
ncbi:hypothetical protein BAUCODRAFT_144875 [Baudoinia panamericana UAMH 10762]|uniref:Uncharacterized protein n=1 Tax=Baudoinia panamericana (strain UAMH 10762) TaxID=717646 RepID=M2N601_BAUPA|nr:uncharacterized protein BAUCODRAFT_144875 [Baudoinia panamericana UAMH 10762]EMC99453.1 hypothetical protein BAUCODRAFT_144875 [Baudoinia panamericana UAMH 10762]